MTVVTKRETVQKREAVHALLDRYPDEALDEVAVFLECRRAPDGTDLSAQAILARHGERPLTAEEFERYFGDLPTDDEG